MNTVRVTSSKNYEIKIGSGLLCRAGEKIAAVLPVKKAVIVSDDNVFALYGNQLKDSLCRAGIETAEFVFAHGEQSKNLATYQSLLTFACEQHLTRKDALVALGGGVVGDLCGFAASTYQRGIGFVQIPTSLLAAVDSSVGGKTGVDLPNGKNQVGSFYQPSLVLCDTDTLSTLPECEYRNGCAEIIKYAMIADSDLFTQIRNKPVSEQYEAIITRCVSIKRDYVEADEFDNGCRMMLNFGHTFGHAVETCSAYTVPHGQAVAVGMATITKAACKKGYCDPSLYDTLTHLIEQYGLPTQTPYAVADMARAAVTDKKGVGDSIHLIVPRKIGECTIEKIPTADLPLWMAAGGIR